MRAEMDGQYLSGKAMLFTEAVPLLEQEHQEQLPGHLTH